MGSDIRMSTNATATKGLAELNNHTQDEQKDVRDGAYGDAHGLSEEDESKFNADAKLTNNEPKELERSLAVHRVPPQPLGPPVPAVRWERFLPLRSLKVLLVEHDDSTRHVVSALLRNCSYEVTAAATGLEAWRTLVDLSHPIDLVLMEVMPGLSGMQLLYKIMSHETCKNIPVITMSSSECMDLVFKCLSKGVVDFLVKPVRKNELKNLWQHVWRRCNSSSGSRSGSESGTRTPKFVKCRSTEESDNNTGSSEEDDASTDLNFGEGSDDGSGTQSSWTKRVVEVDSPQRVSPRGQLADPPDSTCALVIHSRQEEVSDNCLETTSTRECNRKDDVHDDVLGKDLEASLPRCVGLPRSDREIAAFAAGTRKAISAIALMDFSDSGNSRLEREIVAPNGELRKEVDLMVADHVGCVSTKVPNDIPKMNITGNSIHMTEEIPSLDLSLKSPIDIREIETSSQERNVLRHSELSAFSRYNTSTVDQVHRGNVSSTNVKAAITESVQNKHYCGANATANQGSNESTNNNDLGSTTNNNFAKAAASSEKAVPKSALDIHPRSAFHPVGESHISSVQSVILNKDDATKVNTVLKQTQNKQPQIQVQHHHHHYHHHHHHVHNPQQQEKELLSSEDLATGTVVIKTQHSGPRGASSSPVEGNAANYSLSGTVSGSNNACNGRKSSNVFVINGTNVSHDNGAPGGDESASGSRNRVDQNRFPDREAALNKFRQKRKERCFEKKVRYHSRKRLAEERPRVRGQFVRQVSCDSKSKDDDDN